MYPSSSVYEPKRYRSAGVTSSRRSAATDCWTVIVIPTKHRWQSFRALKGEALAVAYTNAIDELGRQEGLVGALFQKARNAIEDPASLQKLVNLIDEEEWLPLPVDVKGAIYEGLLERNAAEVKTGAGQYFTPRPLIDAMVREVLALVQQRRRVAASAGPGPTGAR